MIEQLLEAEAKELERKLELVPEFRRLRVLRKALADLAAISSSALSEKAESTPAPSVVMSARRVATSIGQAALFAIEDAGRPLPVRQLLEEMKKYGKTVGGQNPVWGLSNTLSTDPRFQSIPWGDAKAWWLSGRMVPTEVKA